MTVHSQKLILVLWSGLLFAFSYANAVKLDSKMDAPTAARMYVRTESIEVSGALWRVEYG